MYILSMPGCFAVFHLGYSARGESVVIAMWSTGESVTEAVADRDGYRAAAAAGFASAPKEAPSEWMDENHDGNWKL